LFIIDDEMTKRRYDDKEKSNEICDILHTAGALGNQEALAKPQLLKTHFFHEVNTDLSPGGRSPEYCFHAGVVSAITPASKDAFHPYEVPMFESREIVELAIRLENNGERTYRDAGRVVLDPGILDLLSWMAEEEARHAKWFVELKQDIESGAKNPFLEEMGRELFNDVMGNQSFSLKEVDFAAVGDAGELLAIFIEFEKDTILFYEMIEPFIEDAGCREQLQKIIAEENRHIERIREAIGRHREPALAGG
jgi:rubrerythrin